MTTRTCLSIPQWRNSSLSSVGTTLIPGLQNGLFPGAGQPVGTVQDRRRPFRVVSQCETGNAENCGLFLNSAGVGQHHGAAGLQAKKIVVAERFHDMDPTRGWNCRLVNSAAGSWMHRPIQ